MHGVRLQDVRVLGKIGAFSLRSLSGFRCRENSCSCKLASCIHGSFKGSFKVSFKGIGV